jgi:hypothetical protein
MFRLLAHLVAAYLPLAGRHVCIEDVDTATAVGTLPRETVPPGDDVVLLA